MKGYSPNALKVATRITAINSSVGTVVLLTVLWVIGTSLPGGRVTLIEGASLALGLVSQSCLQVPRAKLVVHRHYRSLGSSEIAGAVAGACAAAIAVLHSASPDSLSIQLGVGTLTRLLVFLYAARTLTPQTVDPAIPWNVKNGFTFGLRIVPLNLAAYCGRALDSGILPYFVAAPSAAAYSRSYQVVVTPITQLQLAFGLVAFERLATEYRRTGRFPNGDRLWRMLWFGGSGLAIAVSLMSGIIAGVLFGPRWPGVQVLITIMAACLPGLGLTLFGSWSTQLSMSRFRSLAHLGVTLVTPAAVISTAYISSFSRATEALFVTGGLVQPILLTVLHRRAGEGKLIMKSIWILLTWLTLLGLLTLL